MHRKMHYSFPDELSPPVERGVNISRFLREDDERIDAPHQLRQRDAELAIANAENNEMKQQINAYKHSLHHMQMNRDEMEKENTMYAQLLLESNTKTSDYFKQVHDIRQKAARKIDALKQRVETMIEERIKLNAILSQQAQRIVDLKREVRTLRAANQELTDLDEDD
jgi:DNA repair exonuclease SbcCD ATPase subunit